MPRYSRVRGATLGGRDTCAAGLLIRLTPTSCDIHTSPAGDKLLASTFRAALQDTASDQPAGSRAA